MRKVTLEQKREAVQITIAGGDPIVFLEQCGSRNADLMWRTIRDNLKEADPDTFAQLPEKKPRKNQKQKNKHVNTQKTAGDAMENMQAAADEFFGKCEEMGLKVGEKEEPAEEDEPDSTVKPAEIEGMPVLEIGGGFGRYRRSDVHGQTYIDFEPVDGSDTLSYTVEQWRNLWKEHKRAAVILGVEM